MGSRVWTGQEVWRKRSVEALVGELTQVVFLEMGSLWFEGGQLVQGPQVSQAEMLVVDLTKPLPVWPLVLRTEECSGLHRYSDSH